MKSLYFNEEHNLFRQSVRQFVEKEVLPVMNEWEQKQQIPKSIWKKMGELGFLGINFPEEYGGSNNDFFYTVILLEEIARSGSAGLAAAHGVHQYMSTAHLLKAGNHELKKKYLPKSISGEWIGALAISEPGAGSDVANIRTTAVREGDYYIINGSKTFITNGVYGDFVTVSCKTNPDAGPAGISLIMVDQGTPGFTTRKLKKMGWHSSDTGELFFDNVKVPVSNLVGNENQGFYYIMESFQLERLVAGIGATAGAEMAIDLTLKYIKEREAFGKPISKFQVIRHALVDIASETEAIKQLVYHTAWLYDNNVFAVKECSMVKMLATELGKKVADVCLQCFGGYGYMEEYPIARMYRDARVGTIVGGTTEIMKEILSKIIVDGVNYESAYNTMKQQENISLQPKENQNNSSTKQNSKNMTAKEILLSLPTRLKTDKAAGIDTTFHFNVNGPNGGEFTVWVRETVCEVKEGLHGEAKCIVTTVDTVYEDVELGRTNPQMAVMMGKIKITNIGEMMKFAGLFNRLS
jgi:alkylation response protein AidB-like acyl-CoA dehydrogenase/putative sterol carrier protein